MKVRGYFPVTVDPTANMKTDRPCHLTMEAEGGGVRPQFDSSPIRTPLRLKEGKKDNAHGI